MKATTLKIENLVIEKYINKKSIVRVTVNGINYFGYTYRFVENGETYILSLRSEKSEVRQAKTDIKMAVEKVINKK
jgi:hypothetical protein